LLEQLFSTYEKLDEDLPDVTVLLMLSKARRGRGLFDLKHRGFFPGADAAIWITSGEPFPSVARQGMSEKCCHFPKISNNFKLQTRCPAHGVEGVGGSNPLFRPEISRAYGE
jgi:hypothetical protein